ncbi:MAG: gamma-glutamylcyclotransferase family protein [Pseudomonadota bacterium]
MKADVPIFSYGTLQLAAVQQANFGRLLAGEADSLRGWAVTRVRIEDPDVLAASGMEEHLALVPDDAAPALPGMLLWITAEELAAADIYEGMHYRRVSVLLDSGRDAWVYVLK